jgi:hypothetical protein
MSPHLLSNAVHVTKQAKNVCSKRLGAAGMVRVLSRRVKSVRHGYQFPALLVQFSAVPAYTGATFLNSLTQGPVLAGNFVFFDQLFQLPNKRFKVFHFCSFLQKEVA